MNINRNKLIEIAIIVGIGIITVEVIVFLAAKKAQAPTLTNQPAASVAQTQPSATVSDNSINQTNPDANGNAVEQIPTAKLGAVNMKKIASVPKNPVVHFNQIADGDEENKYLRDGIDVGSWKWAANQDDAHHYAYVAVKKFGNAALTGEVKLILDGKAIGDVYSDIGDLQFSPDGKILVYHGYNGLEDKTYLNIYNGKTMEKIYVYNRYDLHPQAVGSSVVEGFSADSKHFAYEKSIDTDKDEIFLDGKKIQESNKSGGDVEFARSQNVSDVLYKIAVINYNTDGTYSQEYEYHVNDRLITSEEYNNSIEIDNNKKVYTEVTNKTKWHFGFEYPRGLYFNDALVVNSYDITREVFDIVTGFGDNAAYVFDSNADMSAGLHPVLNAALNGNNAKETFDEIIDMRFSQDNKSVQFIGRKGRDLYSVSYPIIN